MADENDVDGVVNEQVDLENDEQGGETPTGNDQDQGAGEDDHVTISIGEAAPAPEDEEVAKAPQWVRDQRIAYREKVRENRELREKLAAAAVPANTAAAVKKPTLEECNFEEEVYETRLTAWYDQQAAIREAAKEQERAKQKEKDDWQAKLDTHSKAKAALKVPDYADAEETASEIFSVTQQSIIVSGAENSAKVIYALGTNPAEAKKLASITDPVKFAFAVAKLETKLKETPRKAPPAPERQVRGSTPVAIGAGDAELERLRADAAKTGDMSKVHAYKRQKRAA